MNTIWIVLPILIVLMFQLGIELDYKAFAGVFRQPAAVVAGFTGQLLLLPLIAFAIAVVFGLPPVYFMGLMLVACCPGGSSSNVFSMLAKGDVALSVTLTALSSVVTLVTLPFVMALAARYEPSAPIRPSTCRQENCCCKTSCSCSCLWLREFCSNTTAPQRPDGCSNGSNGWRSRR